ncbi:MAG TPA: phosphopantothenoylcysteine decarboxylase, partial [Actinomycetota bacterium]|nr:phosphopantothenoylcysteine decarboxylase [Actinomycetota bacterium]
PVRFIGNRSSGRMGAAVAGAALARGARVILITGPTALPPPPGAEIVPVETAEEMRAAVLAALPEADAVVMAAAVADFRPAERAGRKLKKEAGPPRIELVPTSDILKELQRVAGRQVLVGFAAETEDLEEAARKKLVDKAVDLVVANEVGTPGTGFSSETNRALIVARDGDDTPLRAYTKAELADVVLDRVVRLMTQR